MSSSPPLRRLSSTSSSSKESLINAYEAEEERIINVLSRKLEQLREEKIELENALEAESEAHVNRLSREILALRLAQEQQQQTVNGNGQPASPVDVRRSSSISSSLLSPLEPTPEMMLDALKRENEHLRSRLVDTERDYIRVTRLNEVYREELIEHRRRLGLPVDNLIGLASVDPYSQPTHRRSQSSASSISNSPYLAPSHSPSIPASARVPIPRPPSQIRRPHPPSTTDPTSPSSASASLPSPFPFSPTAGTSTGTNMSAATNITTPQSGSMPGAAAFANAPNPHELSYPSVPPPSLSSSFGDALAVSGPPSPPVPIHLPSPVPIPRAIPRHDRDLSVSPVDSFGLGRGVSLSPRRSFHIPRRSSFEHSGRNMLVSDSPGGLGSGSGSWMDGNGGRSPSRSRMGSMERGARVAETGRLVPRSRAESVVEESASSMDAIDGVEGLVKGEEKTPGSRNEQDPP